MGKCRICLKYSKKMRSIYDAANGITFISMINSLTNINVQKENNYPDQICVSCCKKLIEAYGFKLDIERSEMVLNETANLKRINFNNIEDIKIHIDIDCNPKLPSLCDFLEGYLHNNRSDITYKNTLIRKVKGDVNSDHKTQLTVKEFLDSVKMETIDDSDDHDYEMHAEYDPIYEYGTSLKGDNKNKLKSRKNKSKGNKLTTSVVNKPIKPVYLKDVKITHSDIIKKKKNSQTYKHPKKQSVCPYCGKLLIARYLSIHILKHTSDRPYKCDRCFKTFVTEQFLNNHKKKHFLTAKFKCDQCVASFTGKELLLSHMVVHSEAKNHICNICNKAFKRRYTLSRHLLVHNFGKKSVQCDLCPMTFHSKHFLNHHMRVHTRERPYNCEICSQPYSYKHDFNRHCLKKHGVFLKRRLVNVMNEEVLQQERALMRDLTLRSHGVIKGDDLPSVFEGPKGALAFEAAMKAVEARQIPVACVDAYNI